ncbi:peptidylprolyl isomerase [Roseicitreum antarcticum]|nr:peptidylprolyl isomerase [Roseicitreum antarcticum]
MRLTDFWTVSAAGLRASLRRTGCAVSLTAVVLTAAAVPVQAQQGLFSPVLYVNDRVITRYDLEQRKLFLEAINLASSNVEEQALDALTEDRLREFATLRAGIRLTDEAIADGMTEFAARASLTTDEFIAELSQAGVARETFVDFVSAGLAWRELVQARYVGRVEVLDTEVERAMDVPAQRAEQRVLMAELFLPTDPEFADAVAEILPQILEIRSFEEFSAAARQVSVAGTRDQGGRLDWLPISNLPDRIRDDIRNASPGTLVGPLTFPGAIAIFQVRAFETSRNIPTGQVHVEYARYLIPGGRSDAAMAEAARVQAGANYCPDLYGLVPNATEAQLDVSEALLPDLPAGVAMELAKLDVGEISTSLTEGGALMLLMLCQREMRGEEFPNADQMRTSMLNQRFERLAEIHLEEIRAEAEIRRP